MKLNAVGVTTKDMEKSVEFYKLLGFKFGDFKKNDQHIEPLTQEGNIRLMIDSYEMIEGILGEEPKPSNHSSFAIECESVEELDSTAQKIKSAGFEIVKEPWDAFWGQRYCIVKDPGGYMVDLYSSLKN